MASGFRFHNTDLDSVFAPRYSGWPQAGATGFVIAGYGDINQRYAVLSAGSAAPSTDFRTSVLADLATIFAAAGSTGVQVASQPGAVSGSTAAGYPNGTVTTNTASCAGSKGSGTYTYTWHLASGSGVSFTAPNSATTAITGTVPAAQSISGTMYCTISDGVTSVNTNVVAWSIRNTSMSVATQPGNVSGSAAAGNPSGTVTSGSTSCAGTDGIGGSYTYTWHTSGCTATSPNGSSTTFYATVNASTTDNASAYCTISDGVTSVNTNTISVALTNTSPAIVTVDANLTAGVYQAGTSPHIITYTGYKAAVAGSFTITSGTIPNSGVLTILWTESIEGGATQSVLDIQTGATPIGQTGLISVVINGVTITGSGASGYQDTGGVEVWNWDGVNFNLVDGDTYSVVLTFQG